MHDLEMWRLRKGRREVRAVVRESNTDGDFVGVELRVENNGEIYMTELRQSKMDIERRTAEIFREFEAGGWTACDEARTH